MKPNSGFPAIVLAFAVTSGGVITGCGSANVQSLPVASAIIVHACGAAEADAYIRGAGGPSAVTKTTVHVETGRESDGDVKVDASAVLPGSLDLGVVQKSAKSVEAEIDRLPTLKQCQAWGYLPQLGEGGCLLSKHNPNCHPVDTLPQDPPAPPPSKTGNT